MIEGHRADLIGSSFRHIAFAGIIGGIVNNLYSSAEEKVKEISEVYQLLQELEYKKDSAQDGAKENNFTNDLTINGMSVEEYLQREA